MTDMQIIMRLQKIIAAYEKAQKIDGVGTYFNRMEQIQASYERLCIKCALYERLGMPYRLCELFQYVLLLDEILTGVLFDL